MADLELEEIDINEYRLASVAFMRILNLSLAFLVESRSPHVAAFAIAYALGSPVCEGRSISDQANNLGISPQALSKAILIFSKEIGINASSYSYKTK